MTNIVSCHRRLSAKLLYVSAFRDCISYVTQIYPSVILQPQNIFSVIYFQCKIYLLSFIFIYNNNNNNYNNNNSNNDNNNNDNNKS